MNAMFRSYLAHWLFFLQDFQHDLRFEFWCISFSFHIPTLTSPFFVSKILGPLYYSSFEKKAFTYWIIVQLGIIFIFAVYFNLNNVFLGFFTSYFLGWYRSNQLFYTTYSFFALFLSLPLIIKYNMLIQSGYYYFIYLIIMFIVPFGIKSMNGRIELEKKLDIANNRIEELVKQEERMRISRDLHD